MPARARQRHGIFLPSSADSVCHDCGAAPSRPRSRTTHHARAGACFAAAGKVAVARTAPHARRGRRFYRIVPRIGGRGRRKGSGFWTVLAPRRPAGAPVVRTARALRASCFPPGRPREPVLAGDLPATTLTATDWTARRPATTLTATGNDTAGTASDDLRRQARRQDPRRRGFFFVFFLPV